jgi:exodeoxyribonuclease V alpha subunit
MLFLYSHGMTPSFAARIYRRYRGESIDLVRQNPYRLADDIWGIGFKMADRLAMSLGIRGNAPERLRAAALFALSEAESEGHCFLTADQLVAFTTAAIEVDARDVEQCLETMVRGGEVVKVAASGKGETFEPQDGIYSAEMFSIETAAASRLKTLLSRAPRKTARIEIDDEIDAAQRALGITFAPAQREAIVRAIVEKASIITGGPGTGKTTIIRAIVTVFRKFGKSVFLCAPTGRAAKRLSQATGQKAKTIHRLLRWNAASRTFDFNESNPLECDLLIVDETSMVDIRLFADLLEALRPETRILLVGDADQLPSVGPGSVLRDLLQSGAIASTRLNEIFRQAAASMIISNAHRINGGVMPAFDPEEGQVHDFFFIDRAEPEQIAEAVVEMVASRIPSKYGLSPMSGIQVLTPMHKGRIGVKSLNDTLSEVLNASGRRIQGAAEPISAGDKVMQIRNNYDLDVFNGDIGVVTGLDMEDKKLTVDFDGRLVKYPLESTDELVKAYAISIHKSQGSEYDAVVVPVSTSHYIMLQRNLIYTAVTRARKLVVLVGTKKALAIAVKNDKVRERNTMLSAFLRDDR